MVDGVPLVELGWRSELAGAGGRVPPCPSHHGGAPGQPSSPLAVATAFATVCGGGAERPAHPGGAAPPRPSLEVLQQHQERARRRTSSEWSRAAPHHQGGGEVPSCDAAAGAPGPAITVLSVPELVARELHLLFAIQVDEQLAEQQAQALSSVVAASRQRRGSQLSTLSTATGPPGLDELMVRARGRLCARLEGALRVLLTLCPCAARHVCRSAPAGRTALSAHPASWRTAGRAPRSPLLPTPPWSRSSRAPTRSTGSLARRRSTSTTPASRPPPGPPRARCSRRHPPAPQHTTSPTAQS